jgi:hypothetical protein
LIEQVLYGTEQFNAMPNPARSQHIQREIAAKEKSVCVVIELVSHEPALRG